MTIAWLAMAAYLFALPGVSVAATAFGLESMGSHVVEANSRERAVVFVLHHVDTHADDDHEHPADTAAAVVAHCASHADDHEIIVPVDAGDASWRPAGVVHRVPEARGAREVITFLPCGTNRNGVAARAPEGNVNSRAGPLVCLRATELRI